MTNQSKWLIRLTPIFFTGGVLVPLDYKLTPDEQWQLLKHSGRYRAHHGVSDWRQLSASQQNRCDLTCKTVLVTEAPANADLAGAKRWENFAEQASLSHRAQTPGHGVHCLLLRTGGRPKVA